MDDRAPIPSRPRPSRRARWVAAGAAALLVIAAAVLVVTWRGGGGDAATRTAISPSATPSSATRGGTTAAPTGTDSAIRPASDPWEYCAAIGTIDRPETRVLGDGTRTVIQDALAIAERAPQRFAQPASRNVAIPWRCMDGAVWACDPGANLPCGPANTSRDPSAGMTAYCAEHPDGVLPAFVTGHDTIFAWSCRGGAAVIDRQPFTTDARGFVANFWYRLERPAAR